MLHPIRGMNILMAMVSAGLLAGINPSPLGSGLLAASLVGNALLAIAPDAR